MATFAAAVGGDAGDVSLPALFTEATDLYDSIEESELNSGDPKLQADVAAAAALFARCDMMIRRAAVFSRNEELDDVKTADLPYLLARIRLLRLNYTWIC